MKTFGMKTVIHFGDNALDRLREIPYKRVLIITDPFVVQSKMIDLITEPLAKGGIEYDIFSNVVPDAPVDKVADGVKKFLSYQPEAVIAVGGGSAIDSSKAIREFALKINHYSDVGLIAIPGYILCSCKRHRSQGKISTYFTKSDSRRGNSRCRISKKRTSDYHS